MKGRFIVFFTLFLFSTLPQYTSIAQCPVNTAPPISSGCILGDAIDAFTLNGITTSGNYGCGNTQAYNLYTNPVRTLSVGSTYSFSAVTGISGNYTYRQYFAIWIDLNKDNKFDSTEMLYSSNNSDTIHNGVITIPTYAGVGNNIPMRTRCSYVSKLYANQACTQVAWGETEDYYVNIVQPCTLPVVSKHPTDTILSCGFGNTRFSASAATGGVNYQWQTKAGATWQNLTSNGTYSGTSSKTLEINGYNPDFNGSQYRCIVSNSCGATPTNPAMLSISPSPIVTQPASQSVCVGDGVQLPFTMAGSSGGIIHSYQWYVKTPTTVSALTASGIYSGIDTPLLVMSSVIASMDGYEYFCNIDNGCWYTDTSVLEVAKLPVIVSSPANDTACRYEDASFTVQAQGNNLKYQWQYFNLTNWQNLVNNAIYSNVNTNTLSVQNPDIGNNGKTYRCQVAGACDTVYSQLAQLTVYDDFAITAQPQDSTACPKTAATFRVTTMSSSTLTYQWMSITSTGIHAPIDTPLYLNAKTAELTVLSVNQKLDGTQYYCIVSNRCSIDTSSVATLSVDPCGGDNLEMGIRSLKDAEMMTVYPNPASGTKINILSSFNARKADVRIINHIGMTVLSGTYSILNNKTITLDIDKLPHGVYSIQVHEQDRPDLRTVKFIKE